MSEITSQVACVDFNRSFYVATTSIGGLVNLHTQDFLDLGGGRRGTKLCAVLNYLADHFAVLIDNTGRLLERETLILEMQAASAAVCVKREAKDNFCLCRAQPKKRSRILELPCGLIVGCERCVEIERPAQDTDLDEFENPWRIDLAVGEYEHDLPVVNTVRQKLREKLQGEMFLTQSVAGTLKGSLVRVQKINGVYGPSGLNEFHQLYSTLKLLKFGRYKLDEETAERVWTPCAPPQMVASHMLANQDQEVPQLLGITRLPILRPDGEVITKHGYDEETKLFLAPYVHFDLPIPDQPTMEDVRDAKAVIDELLYDFPFAYAEAKAASAGFLIEQCVRSSLIHGATPGYLIRAPDSGNSTGKSYLARALTLIADGTAPEKRWLHNEEELEKQFLPLIEAQSNVIWFDNVDGFIRSAILEAVLTSREFQSRRLGRNSLRDMVTVPFRSSVLFTSNGALFEPALGRRFVTISLDEKFRQTPLDENKNPRYLLQEKFGQHIHVHAKQMRSRYIRSALLIAKAWIQHGRPMNKTITTLRSFEDWSQVVPHIVSFGGWGSMQRSIEAAKFEMNADKQEAEEFIPVWWEAQKERAIFAEEIGAMAIQHGFYVHRLHAYSSGTSPAVIGRFICNPKIMSFLQEYKIEVSDGIVVTVLEAGKTQGKRMWQLKIVGKSSSAPSVNTQDDVIMSGQPGGFGEMREPLDEDA